MTVCEEDWQSLEADRRNSGVTSRRIYPESVHDLFLQVVYPGAQRALALRTDRRTAHSAAVQLHQLPRTRGLDLRLSITPDGHHDLQVVLLTTDLREVFNALATDISSAVCATLGPLEAIQTVVDRFEHWRRLLQSVAVDGLSSEARRGLFGELVVLRDQVLPSVPASEAVGSWTGPTGAHQDFQLPAIAIEVKVTAAKQPQTIEITSERQLDDRGTGTLLLAHLALDERRGGTGASLNAVVDSVRGDLSGVARRLFDDLLLSVGYLPHQRPLYDEPRYTVRTLRFWRVTGDFPRVIEDDLRPGVGDCRYRIAIAGLDAYLIDKDEVAKVVGGGL